MAWRHRVHAGSSALIVLLACAAVATQSPREAELRAAILGQPGEIERYLQLAEFYQRQNRIEDANRTLRDAVSADPSARRVHEQRVRLFAAPFQPRRIGPIAMDWMTVDGTNPVPVLLTAGHHLRQASAVRGDGTSAAADEIDTALRDVEGAVPAHPDHRGLAAARVTLLQARSSLANEPRERERWLVMARAAQVQVDILSEVEGGGNDGNGLGDIVAAMLRPVPFGPRGAVRAGSLVPTPRLLTDPRLPTVQGPRAGRRFLTLELVIDTVGRVVQVFPTDSSVAYDQALGNAISRWRYEPTRLNGELVPVIVTLTTLR